MEKNLLKDEKLIFVKVCFDDSESMDEIYEILRNCGEDMYISDGLEHWKNPYPKELLIQDCADHNVYIVKMDECITVGTFQIEVIDTVAWIYKVAVRPGMTGKGIGKKIVERIESISREMQCDRIKCNVYDKSTKAKEFYLHNGFRIIGLAQTRRFQVLVFEKLLKK